MRSLDCGIVYHGLFQQHGPVLLKPKFHRFSHPHPHPNHHHRPRSPPFQLHVSCPVWLTDPTRRPATSRACSWLTTSACGTSVNRAFWRPASRRCCASMAGSHRLRPSVSWGCSTPSTRVSDAPTDHLQLWTGVELRLHPIQLMILVLIKAKIILSYMHDIADVYMFFFVATVRHKQKICRVYLLKEIHSKGC